MQDYYQDHEEGYIGRTQDVGASDNRVWKLPNEISYSDAGITVRDTKDLWNMPVIFLVFLLLRFSEWLLRRKWGVV